ncbi:restriction endonuclease subunit S [Paenibacillus agaridevorans]|nr:restriction endonuclease subunit S [Paenibacillus agaridevorans]
MSKWEKVMLGEKFKISSGGTPSTSKLEYYKNGTINWVRTGDLKSKYITQVDGLITEEALKKSSAKLFPVDTVLIAMYGATIGACSILSIEAATNQACAAFLPNKDVDSSYLYFFLSSKKKEFIKLGVGGAQPNISATILKGVEIPLPPLEIQKQIAKTLDTAAELLAMHKQQLVELDNLIKSTFYDMFGDPVANVKGWATKPLLGVGKFISGGTPSKDRNDYWSGNFPWVSPKDMKVAYISNPKNFISNKVFEETSLKKISPNHLLIVVRGMILVHSFPTAINTVEVSINQDMKAILPIKEIDVVYLKHCFDNMTHQILKIITTAGHGTKKFDADSMGKVIIPVPSLHLQNQFADIVTKIEEQKALVKKVIDETQLLFDTLMSEYFE